MQELFTLLQTRNAGAVYGYFINIACFVSLFIFMDTKFKQNEINCVPIS